MTTTPTILVSVTDPVLHPEAINIAAATGMDIIDTSDPRDIVRHAPKAAAILVDATTATHAGGIHSAAGTTGASGRSCTWARLFAHSPHLSENAVISVA